MNQTLTVVTRIRLLLKSYLVPFDSNAKYDFGKSSFTSVFRAFMHKNIFWSLWFQLSHRNYFKSLKVNGFSADLQDSGV